MIKATCKNLAIGLLILMIASWVLFFIVTTPEERIAMEAAKHAEIQRTPQQVLVMKHRTENQSFLKSPVEFEVDEANVYFQGSSIISCMEFTADGRKGKTVLVKRRSSYFFKTTAVAWEKYCTDRETEEYTSYIQERTTKK